MVTSLRRGYAAAAVALLCVSGCSGGSSSARTASVPAAAAAASPAGSVDQAAVAALARAVRVTSALRSYAFVATQRLTGGSRPQATLLAGRAVRPAALSYQLTAGGRTEQVITVGARTYLRVPPAGWKVLAKPGATVDPLASLLTLLHEFSRPTLAGHVLTGQVPATVLSKAGLAPAGAASAALTPVTVNLDAAFHVLAVSLRLQIRAGAQLILLAERSSFSEFDAVRPVHAPGAAARK